MNNEHLCDHTLFMRSILVMLGNLTERALSAMYACLWVFQSCQQGDTPSLEDFFVDMVSKTFCSWTMLGVVTGTRCRVLFDL